MEVKPVTLEGQYVRLDPMELSHVDALFAAGNYPEIWTYMPMRVSTGADMERLVANALAARDNGTELSFVIVHKATGKVVGSTRFLDITPEHRNLEIGWTWLSPEVWRTPVNTECKYLLLKHCFETLGCMRVQLKADSRNARSIAAMERIGAVREGVLRKHRITCDGHIRHSVYFSILDDEWPDVKQALERKLYTVSEPNR